MQRPHRLAREGMAKGELVCCALDDELRRHEFAQSSKVIPPK